MRIVAVLVGLAALVGLTTAESSLDLFFAAFAMGGPFLVVMLVADIVALTRRSPEHTRIWLVAGLQVCFVACILAPLLYLSFCGLGARISGPTFFPPYDFYDGWPMFYVWLTAILLVILAVLAIARSRALPSEPDGTSQVSSDPG